MDNSYLYFQGPPGVGKTHTAAYIIIELIKKSKKIGITANSHKVIFNLLDKIEELSSAKEKITFHLKDFIKVVLVILKKNMIKVNIYSTLVVSKKYLENLLIKWI